MKTILIFLLICIINTKIHLNGEQYVNFENSCNINVKESINSGVAAIHSFEYGIGREFFTKVINTDKSCAIGYWGIAMTFHFPIWFPPTTRALELGYESIKKAKEMITNSKNILPIEKDFIDSLFIFYDKYNTIPHYNRTVSYHDELRKLYFRNSIEKDCVDGGAFYSLMILGKELVSTKKPGDGRHDNELRGFIKI
jgi:hypothetical protein